MNFDQILDDCGSLENTISMLIKANANKDGELRKLQEFIIDNTQTYLNQTLELERNQKIHLNDLKCRRNYLETEIKKYVVINEKLSELVSIAQRNKDNDNDDISSQQNDVYYDISEIFDGFEQIRSDYNRIVGKMEQIGDSATNDAKAVKNLIKESHDLIVNIHRNNNMIRLSEQQNKYADQQFDLILAQLPWEPLSKEYIDELRRSSDKSLRDMAENLQIQANEIQDLNESIQIKRENKLKVLEGLATELGNFLRSRQEAAFMSDTQY